MTSKGKKMSHMLIIVGLLLGTTQSVLADETTGSDVQKIATETVDNQVKAGNELQANTPASEELAEVTTEETTTKTSKETAESGDSTSLKVTQKETDQLVEEVDSFIKETVGELAGEPIDLTKIHTASSIRETLLSAEYSISKAELNKYSDKQLEDAMTLFLRYNYDVSGMDPGNYVRLLTTLYTDKTVSLVDAFGQLSFNPSSFNSFGEMIPQVEALQLYLATLYPVNSSFIPGKTFTNEELIAILTHLDAFETQVKAQGGKLAGRIVYILNDKEYGQEIDTVTSSDNQDKDKPIVSSTPKKVVDNKKENESRLPQTGEEKAKTTLIIVGAILIIGAVVLLILKRKKKLG